MTLVVTRELNDNRTDALLVRAAATDPSAFGELYSRHVIPGYAHMDCFIGQDAARDVYPTITAQLDRHN